MSSQCMMQLQTFKEQSSACRRIANVYFTLVAVISCTSLSPVR
jgi:hypothetical protein